LDSLPSSKSELLDLIQTGRRQFLELISELSPEQFIAPGAVGDWSVKDLLAHILVHEQRMVRWVGEVLRGANPQVPQPFCMPEDELAQLNADIFRVNRSRPLLDLLRELDAVHAQSLALVAGAAEADLFDPSHYALREGEALCAAVAANTYEHDQEHSSELVEFIARAAG
jgi:hypothetical protein